MDLITLMGIVGMISLVICYVSMLIGKLKPSSYKFLFGNLVGGILLMLNGFLTPGMLLVYPILNLVWTIGTLIQIYREWQKRKK